MSGIGDRDSGIVRRVLRMPGLRALRREARSELEFHIHERIEELMSKGRTREDAEREVRARFGDVARIEAELDDIDRASHRRRGVRERAEDIARDARLALRGMARRPLAAAVVVITLALAIGANTAIYSIVDRLLLHPLPAPALDRMLVIKQDMPSINLFDTQLSPAEALDLAQRTDLFERAAGYTGRSANLTGEGEPRRVSMTQTTGDFFALFAVRPFLGRLYRPEDSREGAPRVAVLSYRLWRDLGADSASITAGRSIELNGQRVTVIGVLPPDFRFPRTADLFAPFVITQGVLSPEQRNSLYFTFVARRRADVTPERLTTQLAVEISRWAERFSGSKETTTVLRPVPLTTFLAGELRPVTLVLGGAVVLVLLIACANVGSLQLVKTAARAQELAVRAALGAGRGAILRQSLVESLVLALAGGVLGAGVGWAIVRGLTQLDAGRYAMLHDVRLDPRTLAFTAAVAVVAGLLFGSMPAWRASRVDLNEVLKESSRGSSSGGGRQRLLRAGVVVQLALTLVLLVGSLLTVRSLARLAAVDPGFHPQEVTTLRLSLPGASYSSPTARIAFYDELVARLRATPGIVDAGLTASVPFGGGGDSSPFDIPGQPVDPSVPPRHANIEVVHGDYFRTMGIPLLAGRDFTTADAGDAVSAIIDANLAKAYFKGGSPIGRTIDQGRPATIVGVVGSVPRSSLGEERHATVYYHYPQYAWLSSMVVVARSALPAPVVVRTAQGIVKSMNPQLPVYEAKPMTALISGSTAPQRLAMLALSGFAALSLLLSLLGIYGVMSYSMAQRTQEIGIRMALGARAADVVRMVVASGLVLAALGLVAGFAIYLAASRAVSSLLFGVSVHDPLVLVVSAVVLLAVTAIAAYVPARRASRIDAARVMGRS